MAYRIEALRSETWPGFSALAEKHNGVWGGCWCTWFHRIPGEKGRGVPPQLRDQAEGAELTKRWKEHLVGAGCAHAALVFDGDTTIAWCQYGTPNELPNIYHRKEYQSGLTEPAPPYRITCFFVDRDHRRRGVAEVALQGALDLIASEGGGTVDAFPNDVQGKKTSSSFLHNGTRTMFERAGFEYLRPLGTKKCLMRRQVAAG
jgi:GNAT superfamily N-acetyltransferase